MKFGQFMSYPKEIISSKKSAETPAWKLVPGPFVFAKSALLDVLNKLLKTWWIQPLSIAFGFPDPELPIINDL